MATHFPILDGHNDVLSRLLDDERADQRSRGTASGGSPANRGFFERSEHGHIDLPRAREGGFGGGLFSIYVSADLQAAFPAGGVLGETRGLQIRFPRALELGYAQRTALAELGWPGPDTSAPAAAPESASGAGSGSRSRSGTRLG